MYRTRKALIEGFGEILKGQLRQYAQDQVTSNNWLKTQIIELDQHGEDDPVKYLIDKVDTLLTKHSLEKLDEPDFYGFTSDSDPDKSDLYIDASDKRFVRIYTFLGSNEFDHFINNLTANERIDQVWLPQIYMNDLFGIGNFRGYGGKFNNKYFIDGTPKKDIEENPDFVSLSFRSWGNSRRILDLINKDPDAKQEFALTSARTKIYFGDYDDQVIDDIGFSGKITSLGNSFVPHLDMVNKITESYRDIIVKRIEEPFAISYKNNSISGSKVVFILPKPLKNLRSFVNRLVSGRQPFKLWGVASKIEDDFARIEAVDLHVSSRLSINIYPKKMEVYFEEGSCGNTILRLLTLLQQNYNSTVSIVDRNGELVELGMMDGKL